jgi:hypothetical protein
MGAVLVTSMLAACSGPGPPEPADSGKTLGPVLNTAVPVEDQAHLAASHSAATDPAFPAPGSGNEAALQLEALLGQHSILAADMMRARIRQDADLAQSADAALGQNTEALAGLLKPVIGAPAGDQFAEAWAEHVQALFSYASALASADADGREDAHHELVEYEEDLAQFFANQSHGRLDRTAALAAVRVHVDHLVDGADAYAAKKYPVAAGSYRHAYSHSFELGADLARALLPAKVGTALESPALTLRSTLTRLLGEHVALVIAAMRSAAGDRADFAAMGAAVNANTLDLTAAFDSLFGPSAARGFQTRWADHVDQLMAYTSATIKPDAAGQEAARRSLREVEKSFASFLNTATENRLGEPALTQGLVLHDRMLLAEVDAYAAGKFQQAQDLAQQTAGDMFTLARQLSGAIGATLGARLPRGGSQTGGGGTAVG